MGIKILLEPEAQLFVQRKRGRVYQLSQFVFISEDINYTAEDTIDLDDEAIGDIEYCLIQHGGSIESDRDIAVAVFKDKCERGEYSPK